jgi:hypothetical protein
MKPTRKTVVRDLPLIVITNGGMEYFKFYTDPESLCELDDLEDALNEIFALIPEDSFEAKTYWEQEELVTLGDDVVSCTSYNRRPY